MTSLAEVYEGHVGEVQSLRRLYLGTGLFLAGTLLVVGGIVFATTELLAEFGLVAAQWQAREVAGVLAGLGVPSVFVGVFTILPADKRIRAAAAIGASVAVLGVVLFTYAYPYDWAGVGADHTLPVVAVYFFGTIVTFWCLFTAVANFKTRNDPGGTVSLEITTEGEVRTVEVDREELQEQGLGGIGFLGDVPDGETRTQTNQSAAPRATSDGGTTTQDIRSPLDDAEVMEPNQDRHRTTDRYCGNCEHFRYVRRRNGMEPYCDYHGGVMNDMDACDQWEPNRRD